MFSLSPIYKFLIAIICFIAYNEFVILPYYIWTPSSMMTIQEMSQRNPFIHLGLLAINFSLIALGLKAGEKTFSVTGSDRSFNGFKANDVLPQIELRGKQKLSLKVDSNLRRRS